MRENIALHCCHNGNWIINLTVSLCTFNIIISCDSNNGPKRLISLVRKGHAYIEERSCLKFEEHNPVALVHRKNVTFLFYTYSGVLENCCLPFFTKPTGRRLILITPVCTLPSEVAHVTLHGLGLEHRRHESFSEVKSKAVLFPTTCLDAEEKLAAFESKQEEDLI